MSSAQSWHIILKKKKVNYYINSYPNQLASERKLLNDRKPLPQQL